MRRGLLLALIVAALLAVGAAVAIAFVIANDDGDATEELSSRATASVGYLAAPASDPGEAGEEGETELLDMLLARYRERSFPEERVAFAQTVSARSAFAALPLRVPSAQARRARSRLSVAATWQPLGPTVARALPQPIARPLPRADTVSGRVTALLFGPRCVPGDCRLWLGAAGGGVFRTDDALAAEPVWASKSAGLMSGAIGFLARDPSDATGRTIYVGTGEARAWIGVAGEGVFRSTDGGDTWSVLAGSPAVAGDAAVSGIVVDPRRPQTIYISTQRSFHGASSVVGGDDPPPGAPAHGVYVTDDGGATFSLLYSSPRGSGTRSVNGIALDPNDPDTIYAAVIGEGLVRRSQRLDGDLDFHRVFEFSGVEAGDNSRVEFALADFGERTRVYVGSANPFAENPVASGDDDREAVANVYRTDDAGLPAAEVRSSWNQLSSTKREEPGFASYRYCGFQCWYGNFVASPPGQPDVVWLGGNFEYAEARRGESAGRAVLRSTDAGDSFNDVSSDARTPRFEMHPDQHVIAFSPNAPDVAFIGSDGGLVRLSGEYTSVADRCSSRLEPVRLTFCRGLLARVPTQIDSLNAGLDTLQLQSVSLSANPQARDLLIGTQDNGTWSYTSEQGWRHVALGDGGQSGIDARDPRIRFHSFYGPDVEINHSSGDPGAWRGISDPLFASKEHASFYPPIIADPRVGGSMFIGLQHVWRTQDSGGPRNGDWVALGSDLTGTSYGSDRRQHFVVAVERAPSDTRTLWAATFAGRVFVSTNADGPPESVTFARVDVPTGTPGTPSTPGRFVSGIAIDPRNPNHAWVSYSGYDAYTPDDQRGHVFEVVFDPGTGSATWTNRSYNLEDQPITDIAYDPTTGDLYASTDYGVTRLAAGATAWTEAARGLPFVAVFGLTITPDGKTLYAATHGRGLWALELG